MTEFLDPKIFGLSAKTVLETIDDSTVALLINRKSRIVMADGKKILLKVEAVKKLSPELKVILKTSAPVCSKTIEFLNDNGITVG